MADNEFGLGYAMGQDSGGRNGGGLFGGGDGWWGIILLALLFGWGGNGNGMGGGGMGNVKAAVSDGFAFNGLDNGIRGVQQGLCDGFYAMNTGLLTGFNGVQMQVANLAAQNQQCCCETQRLVERGFADTNYNLATQSCEIKQTIQNTTRDLIDNQNANTRSILDFLVQDKLTTLQAENADLRRAASQDRQSALFTTALQAQADAIVNRIAPYPVPSYTVPAPYPYCGGAGSGSGGNGGFALGLGLGHLMSSGFGNSSNSSGGCVCGI